MPAPPAPESWSPGTSRAPAGHPAQCPVLVTGGELPTGTWARASGVPLGLIFPPALGGQGWGE